MSFVRHFTATGFVVHDDHLALHWHTKIRAWLPPGGHIAENEDPVQAVLREIREETGLSAKVVQVGPSFDLGYPTQVTPPITIMVEDIQDPIEGHHQHIDMIYVCRLAGPALPLNAGWRWVSRKVLTIGAPIDGVEGQVVPPPEDVRILALRAFEIVPSPPKLTKGASFSGTRPAS